MTAGLARIQLRVRGRVQGVYYRASAQAEARRLGVTGWIRNEPDGSVRAIAEGPREQLEALAQWCHHGPDAAQVESVEIEWSEPTDEFATFSIDRPN